MKLTEVYRLVREEGEMADRARLMLHQRHWFTNLAEFDPRTGNALALDFKTVTQRLQTAHEVGIVKDRLWRIIDHSRESIHRLFRALNENPRRDQALLPLRAVRELNASSFIALSRRPGRNVREKLADKPYMQAVRRFQSIDLPQNRLLKEFVTRLVDLLEIRGDFLGERDNLVVDIHRWLQSDEALAISRWQNIPANNTLLSHHDYRRIWDAWRWLQSLDEDSSKDLDSVDARATTIAQWDSIGEHFSDGKSLLANIPVLFDYDLFTIEPWCSPILVPAPSAKKISNKTTVVTEPACIDLTGITPVYATINFGPQKVDHTFVWQSWQGRSTRVSINAFDADLVVLHTDAESVTLPDLFFGSAVDPQLLDQAALAFSRQLRTLLRDDELVWLVPDCLNDFRLATLRRNINAQFGRAEPLPRSIAAVFENVDYSKIKREGFEVAVFDTAGGITFATKLVARFDADLKERVPETRGFFWERTPHFALETDTDGYRSLDGVARVNADGHVISAAKPKSTRMLGQAALRYNDHVGKFDLHVAVTKSPVRGGALLHHLQRRAGDIPLWRDSMPTLSIRIIRDGMRQPLYLVEARTTVKPIRDMSVVIPITESFTLPKGQRKYNFPLYQGDSTDDSGFMAELASPAFPLSDDARCTLKLTYTYGANDPYCLEFVPDKNQFPPVKAVWRPIAESEPVDLSQLVVPPFPPKKSWESLRRWPRPTPTKTGETENDLLGWIQSALEPLALASQGGSLRGDVGGQLARDVSDIMQERRKGQFLFGKHDKNGNFYCFVDCDGEEIFCHGSQFIEPFNEYKLGAGDSIYLYIDDDQDRTQGKYLSHTQKEPPQLEATIRRHLSRGRGGIRFDPDRATRDIFNASFPSHVVWRDGRTVSEHECPNAFRSALSAGLVRCEALYLNPVMPQELKDEIYKFVCRLHVDTPELFQGLLIEAVESGRINYVEEQGISCAIGTCSEDWQQYLLHKVLESDLPNKDFILSRALWKSAEPVRFLEHPHVNYLLYDLESRLSAEIDAFSGDKSVKRIGRMLEIVLALLRTRASDDLELKALLAPDSAYGRSFTRLLDDAIPKFVNSGATFHSRVEISVDKPVEFRKIPDLMYALRLYLTGDDGANAVRITEISDSTKD